MIAPGVLDMRKPIVLVSLAALAACSGGGPQSPGGTPVIGGGSTTHSFIAPTEKKTYSAIGGVQRYTYSTDDRNVGQYNQLYAGNASTARNSGITVSYDPRDAIFEVTISDSLAANASDNIRFQDPAHRTDFGGAIEPQDGTPQITGAGQDVHYLEVGSGEGPLRYDLSISDTFPVGDNGASRDHSTFFYEKPGTTTKYVTYAGFVRNATSITEVENPDGSKYLRQDNQLERAAFVFGERTDNNAVPRTGTATFTGDMVASMVYNPLFDNGVTDTYFQWIDGSATTNVDFGANSFSTSLTGTVRAPQYDAYTSRINVLNAGATFAASGSGTIDLVNKGGFSGQVTSASFNQGGNIPVNIAGSSIDGAFFGPAANEVGGGFRIVGGTPDERIDILGAFTGVKP